MRTYIFNGTEVVLEKTAYRDNGTLAVLMNTLDDERYATITVNLRHPFQSESMAFLDENNVPGIGKWIEENRLGEYTGVRAASGFCIYPLYMLY